MASPSNTVVARQIQLASERLNADCRLCGLSSLCHGDCITPALKHVEKGKFIFQRGEQDGYLYSIRSGAVKISRHRIPGEEQVLGFYFAGDVFGFDSMSAQRRQNDAIALEDCTLCRLPLKTITSDEQPSQNFYPLLRLLGDDALYLQEHIALMNRRQASTRLAAFLLDIASRGHGRDGDRISFSLPMSRLDIANYLGLTIETVSRRLCDLERDHILVMQDRRKTVHILDLERLRQIALL